ncbi:MAG: right-handed parallel beta-helix repeat-containing protein [Planctomycetota bacterium]
MPANAADLSTIIVEAIAAGEKRIVIPPGQYRVEPQDREHLRLEGLRDVEIIANGVELICTQTTRAITIKDCHNLTIRSLTIDYDPLPFTQGRIVASSADHATVTFEIVNGYPTEGIPEGTKIEIFDGATDSLRTNTYYGAKTKLIGDNRFLITKPAQFRQDRGELEPQIGDIVVVRANHAPGGSIPHAVYMQGSENLLLEGVTLYAAPVFGFLEVGCNGTVYRGCVVDRRPLASDLKPRGHRRIRSLNADAFHSKSAQVGPQYLACVAKHQGDDAFAVNGHYHLITAGSGSTLRVLGKRDGGIELAVADPVELVTYDGHRLPEATILAIEPDGAIGASEREFLQSQHMHAGLKNTNGMLNDAYRITLDRSVDVPIGSVIASMNRVGNGFRIEGCTLGENRSRGILVKSSGVIKNNTITGTWGEAIKVAPEWWWLEAGNSVDVTIEGNTIRNTRGIPIAVFALAGNGEISPAGAHEDIVIRGNRIADSPAPAIYVTSTRGLTLDGNDIGIQVNRKIFPWVASRYQLDSRPDVVELINTTDD